MKYKPVIEQFGRKDLWAFTNLCKEFAGIDAHKFFRMSEQAMNYYRQSISVRAVFRPQQEIENRWYASLAAGKPDYTVYADPYMLVEVWSCWVLYSRGYIRLLDALAKTEFGSLRTALGKINSIGDIGCGCAYTTAAWKESYPFASVYGTQYPNSAQFQIASKMGRDHEFQVLEKLDQHVDLVFASEYFEHWISPVEHLDEIILTATPNAMIIANAFGAKSVGHFDVYLHKGVPHKPSEISRRFNERLREHGFTLLKTKFWNNRPSVWIRKR